MLLTPKTHEPLPSFQKKVEYFLKNDRLIPYLKATFCVGKSGLLHTLLNLTNHLWIDLAAFSPLHIPMPMTVLTDHYQGCRILRISESGIHDVPKILREQGIEGFVFAQITDDGKFTFSREKEETFSIHPQFMRKLFRYLPSKATLSCEAATRASVLHKAITDRNSSYLAADCRINCDEVVERNGVCCSAAIAKADGACFKSALYATLASVASLCACGIPYAAQLLSIGLELPKQMQDPNTVGSCIAQILGLYRAQAELTLPAQAVSVCEGESNQPSVTAFSVAPGKALPSSFSKIGSTIYCISPQMDSNGLPDFNSLRRLLERITVLGRQGAILSIRLLCSESITDGLQSMRGALGYQFTDPSIVTEAPLDFAILLESDRSTEFRAVATTKPRAPLPQSAPSIPDISNALNRGAETQVVIFAKSCDNDALALASYLEGRGSKAKVLFDSQTDTAELVREIITAQAVILCNNTTLPNDPRITFALETLQRAKGCLLSFREPSDPSVFVFHNGITEAQLQKICKK